jgi:peptide/nickel transport system permease protein
MAGELMARGTTGAGPAVVAPEVARLSLWRAILSSTEGKIGVALIAFTAFIVVFGPLLAPDDPLRIGAGPQATGPSAAHLLGTDSLGRDVLSRVLSGGRSVLLVPLAATCLAFILGTLAGVWSAYVGGRRDAAITRGLDVLLALPPILVVLVIATTAGRGSFVLIVSIGLIYAPRIARVLRGATIVQRSREYVQAAQARGERSLAIVANEILPNITPTLFVEFASRLSFAIIFIATLNFLGLGVQPPNPDWGLLVAENRASIGAVPIATYAPAIAIGMFSVSVGLLADAVTQAYSLDRGRRR